MAKRAESHKLAEYRKRRRFDATPEPRGSANGSKANRYLIQKHAARRLHYDFRLELDGVLKSWAVTKGPSLNPATKRLAVRTEDHPIEYANFEGRIPEGNYGAGAVALWDRGTWKPIGNPRSGLRKGKLVFDLDGERLHGRWAMVRMRGRKSETRENWLLIKEADERADRTDEITSEYTTSVVSGRSIDEIAKAPDAVWHSEKAHATKVTGKLPLFVKPMMASLVDDVPEGGQWIFEVKLDGYRALTAVCGDRVRMYTRGGLDWTAKFRLLSDAIAGLNLPPALLDGEIAAVDRSGRTDFGALTESLRTGKGPLSYFVFDLLSLDGRNLTKIPLLARKERLKKLLGARGRKGPVFFVDHVTGDGRHMLDALCDKKFEGIIAKKANGKYQPGKRSASWLKIKCGTEQEFVVVGWSPSTKKRAFSSLLLATRTNGKLRYAGRVGSGFSGEDLSEISARLEPRKTKPVEGKVPRAVERTAHWVKPTLVAQVAFSEFTRDGLVRQGRFLGLRGDKRANAVRRETPRPLGEVTA